MTAKDSNWKGDEPKTAALPQPGSFRFWLIASVLVVIVAGATLAIMDGSAPVEPILVLKLDPNAAPSPADKPDAEADAAPVETPSPLEPQVSSLIAADGTVITDPALIQTGVEGQLPVIAKDGRKPMNVYAGRFDVTDPRPRVAIIVAGLGLGEAATQAAIDKLPPSVTLALTPYGSSLQTWAASARSTGHEVVVEVPMEPFDYPDNDPGPNTLLTGEAGSENMARLRWVMSRFSGYAGVMNVQGGKFLSSREELLPFLGQLTARGLYMVDSGQSQRSLAQEAAKEMQTPFLRAQIQIDQDPSRDSIEKALNELAAAAREKRWAIGVASAAPGTVDRIANWAKTLDEQGVALAPLSAVLSTAQEAPQ